MQLPVIEATRYVTPLREGGSLAALVEASDDGLYVLKFRGAGQGRRRSSRRWWRAAVQPSNLLGRLAEPRTFVVEADRARAG